MRPGEILIYCLILSSSGCAFLANPRGVSTLSSLAESQQEQKQYIKQQEDLFYKLRSDVENERLKKGISQQEALDKYGEPVSTKASVSQQETVFVYRHPTRFFSSDLIYLKFDAQKLLSSWELMPAEQ